MVGGKTLSAFADEVDVAAFFEDQACGMDGVAESFDTGDAAGLHAAAVHEEGIELDAAIGGEEAAAPGVEGGIVFEDGDGGFDGVDSRTAETKDAIAGLKSGAHAGLVSFAGVDRDGPGSAMNEESWIVRRRGGHPPHGRTPAGRGDGLASEERSRISANY
jgi:hypothetical protein